MTKHIKVNSISTAWEVAASIFPTDYQKDEESSKRAGYPIYKTTSTDESFSGFHISDLNTRLEVSMGAETAMIWVEENEEEVRRVNIFAEVTIDETGIIKQIDAVKEAADRFEDEALKLRGMLAQAKATAKIKKEKAEEK